MLWWFSMKGGKRNNPVLLLAISFLTRSKKNFKFSLIAMIIGVWGIIVVTSIINGFDSLLIDSITNFYPHLVVRGNYTQNSSEIDKIVNFNISSVAVINQSKIAFSQLMELDDLSIYEGFINEESDTDGLILGNKLANNLNVGIGDTIITIRSKGLLPIFQESTITGIFDSGVYSYDSTFILSQNSNSKEYTGIFLKNPNKAQQFKEKYLSSYSALTWEESNETLAKAVQFDSLIAFTITFFILLISGFSISNSVSFSIFTRKKEIAILRALGFQRRQISTIFILETFLISLVGFVLGVIAGILTCWFLIILKIPLPEGLFYVEYLPIKITASSFLIAFLMNCFVSIFFSYVASRRAASFNIVESLKDE